MAAPASADGAAFPRKQLESASPGRLCTMVKTFAEALMSAESDVRRYVQQQQHFRIMQRVPSRSAVRRTDWIFRV
jgi:hypothetical protein